MTTNGGPSRGSDFRKKVQRSSPKGAKRRDEIIESASRSFASGGYHSVSLAEIADDVGLSQPGLLHHFPSKSDLLLAVLQERRARNEDQRRRDLADGVDFIAGFIKILRANAERPDLIRLYTVLSAESLTADHPAKEWFLDHQRSVVAEMSQHLSQMGVAERLPEGATVETVARWIIAMADGLRLQWLMDPDAVDRIQVLEGFLTWLEPILGRREGRRP